MDNLLSRAVIPTRLALISRAGQTVGYNPNLNVWYRVDDDAAEVLRWLRAGRDRASLAAHLSRRFQRDPADAEERLGQIVRWAVLRRLLFLDAEPDVQVPHGVPTRLATVYWICTQACNLRCVYCYQEATVPRPHELSTQEGLDLVDQAVEVGASTFVFTGGEPFSRRDVMEIARYSRSRGLRTNVITNGHYITPRRIDEVAEIFHRVTVSLDHGVPEHHDRSRGQGSWRKAAAAVDLLLDAGVPVDVNSVLTRPGLDDAKHLLDFVRSRTVGQHRIVPQYPMGRGAESRDDELAPEQLLDFEDELHRIGEELDGSTPGRRHACEETKGSLRTHCGAGLSELSVDPEGWVYPCKLLQYGQNRLGNVRERRLAEIFTTDPGLAGIQRAFTETLQPCSTCVIRRQCGGGCRGIHASFSGDWATAEPLFCAQLRRTFELEAFSTTGSLPARQKPSSFVQADGGMVTVTSDPGDTAFIPLTQVVRR